MKKLVSIIIAVFLLCSMNISAFAATKDTTLTYIVDVSGSSADANGNSAVSVKAGDIITVEYYIKNGSASDEAELSVNQNQIKYDHNFFQLVSTSIKTVEELNGFYSTGEKIDSDKNATHYIFFNTVSSLTLDSQETFKIGSFQLKVLAKSGSSTIENVACKAADRSAIPYGSAKQDITVSIEGAKTVPVSGVELETASGTMLTGATQTLSATVVPYNATDKTVTWSSSNSAIAAVDANGKITAKAAGTAIITVTTADGDKTASYTVTVADQPTPVEIPQTPTAETTPQTPAEETPVEETVPETPTVAFTDVKKSNYFYDAVLWAVENEITLGKTATLFDPSGSITRAQAVTFLWRAAGCPVVNYAMSFTDVEAGAYYAEAVRWAVAEGITKGVDATHFAPGKTCTRGQIVSFLYRYAKASPVGTGNPFTDVKTGAYYYDAVLWAVSKGITGGTTASTFAPKNTCSRAQVVTFLYRYMGK